jgi:predicted metal-binding protein
MNDDNMDGGGTLKTSFEAVARKRGVDIYPLEISKIRPSQSMRLKCQVPLCEYYDVCKTCPPNIPSVADFRDALLSYSKAFLVVLREKIKNIDDYRKDFSAELKLADIVSELELAAFKYGSYQAIGLSVGGCKLCEKCAPRGEPCRHPFKARPSPEGFGIDITLLARDVGVAVEWPPKDFVNFLGLVLV